MIDPSLGLAGRILGTLVFGSAVSGKLRHYDEFVGVVGNYRVLPLWASASAAWLVIGSEIYVCVGLATPWFPASATAVALVLLGVFIIAMGVNLLRGRREIDCGCFQSAQRQQLHPALLLRNMVLMLILLPVLLATTAATGPLQWVDGIAAGLVGFVLYQALNQILALGTLGRPVPRS